MIEIFMMHQQQQQQEQTTVLVTHLINFHPPFPFPFPSLRSSLYIYIYMCIYIYIYVYIFNHRRENMTSSSSSLARVRLSELVPYDGAPSSCYIRAIEVLSDSLTRYNAVVIELESEDEALMRCGLESARLYFRVRAQNGVNCSISKRNRGVYMYRAGRAVEDTDSPPPCMADVFRCMGKVARVALCAIAKHLRLQSNVFNHLLDDNPLPANEPSSSVLVASYRHMSLQNGKGALGGGNVMTNCETEKGLLTLVCSDAPGLQVCDPNGRWYLADCGSAPGDLILLIGKSLSHATAGLRPAALCRLVTDHASASANTGRSSLAFRLMPQSNAILDCSPITAAGHVIPQSYVPISVSQFMDGLSSEVDILCNHSDNAFVARTNVNKEPTLRSVLSDSLSGAFLEDATLVSCGHSFGGLMLRRVIDTIGRLANDNKHKFYITGKMYTLRYRN